MTMATDKQDKVLNVPTLRFPEFTDEWELHPTTDFFEFKNGLNPDSKRFGSGTKFISVMDILNNRYITYDKIKAFVEPKGNDLNEFGVNYGDILFQRSSETLEDVGRANVYLDKKTALFGGFVIRGKKIGDYNPLFFRYLLSSPHVRKRIVVKGAGAQHFNIGQDGLSKISIFVPTTKEQERIAQLFDLIDERIEAQIRIIDKLQSLMKGLNDYLQDSVPLSYSLSFSDIGEDYSGLSGKNAEDFGSGKPYITYVSIYANNFVDDDCSGKVSIERGEKQNVVQKGDMLFTLSSETPEEVCYGAVYSGNSTETYLNSFCFGVRNTEEKVFSPYMAYFFNSSRFRREVYPLAQGSTRFNLQKSDFLQKHFLYPSIEDQHRIFEILNAYDNKIKVENQILAHYQLQKEFLLRNLFI